MILTTLLSYYQTATTGWYADLFPIAHHLFLLLAAIEVIWCGIRLALEQESLTETTGRLLLNIMAVSFFYAILFNANTWIPAIIDGFVQSGEKAAHTGKLDPSAVIDQGIATTKNLYATLGWQVLSPPILVMASLSAVVILLCFALIAGIMLATLLDMYLTIGAGVLLLGFGGSRWTRPIAERFLSKVVAVGTHLFLLYLIIGAGQKIFNIWAADVVKVNGAVGLDLYAVGIVLPVVYLFVVWRTPNKASDLMAGVFSFTTHEGERMAASMIPAASFGGSAIGSAAQAVGTAAAPAMAAITNAVSAGGQAVMSSFSGQSGPTPPVNSGVSGGGQATGGVGVTQFRNAGATTATAQPAQSQSKPAPSSPNLAGVKDAHTRAILEKWSQRP